MPPRRRAPRAAAPLLALALAPGVGLAACGDDQGGGADGTTTSAPAATTTAEAPTTTSGDAATTSTTEGVDHGDEDEGLAELEALVPQLLVAAADLGSGAEEVGFRPDDEVDCSTDGDHPPDVLAGTGIAVGDQVVEEAIRVYPSADAATAAFEAWLAFPPSCTFGLGAAMGAPADGGEAIGADRSVVYEAAADGGARTTLVVALVGDALVTTSIAGIPGHDPLEVAAFAVGKLLAALEA